MSANRGVQSCQDGSSNEARLHVLIHVLHVSEHGVRGLLSNAAGGTARPGQLEAGSVRGRAEKRWVTVAEDFSHQFKFKNLLQKRRKKQTKRHTRRADTQLEQTHN